MEQITRPTGTVLADEIGISRGTFSMVQAGKRRLSAKTQARWDSVMGRYERAEQVAALEQRELENLAAVGRRVLEASR